jgi:DNA/RNA non-specific endonuclease
MHGATVNQSRYRRLENRWAKAIKAGKDVDVTVDLIYLSSSSRPDIIRVIHRIDADVSRTVIRNSPSLGLESGHDREY